MDINITLEGLLLDGASYDPRFISLPATVVLISVVLAKGADLGVKALYAVAAILALSLAMFFLGTSPEEIRAKTLEAMGAYGWGSVPATPASIGEAYGKIQYHRKIGQLSGDVPDFQD